MTKLRYWIRFWFLLFKYKIKGDFGYHHRSHTLVNLVVMILGYFGEYVAIWVVVDRFRHISGWSTYEVLFLYSLNLFSYAAGGVFSQCFWQLDGVLLQGGLDEIMLRPMNTFAIYLTRGIAVQYVAHMSLSAFFMTFSLIQLGTSFSVGTGLWLLGVVVGASLIQASLTIIFACTAFWTKQAGGLVNFVIQGMREFIRYPISIYPKIIQAVLTFGIPYAFVNFYPSYVLFDKTSDLAFNATFQWYTLVIGVGLAGLAYLVWSRGLRRYESIGA